MVRFIGDGIEDFVRRALPIHHRDNNGIDECVEEMRSRYARLWKRKSRPYSGIETLLSILQDSGLKLGILSNKPDDFTREMVAYIFHQYHFESVKGAVQGTPKKPDPTGAIAIAEQMKTTPDHCIYIGDSEVDIQTAKNAGMVSVGVTWGFRTRDDLVKNGAEIIIDEPEQLIPVLHHISAKS